MLYGKVGRRRKLCVLWLGALAEVLLCVAALIGDPDTPTALPDSTMGMGGMVSSFPFLMLATGLIIWDGVLPFSENGERKDGAFLLGIGVLLCGLIYAAEFPMSWAREFVSGFFALSCILAGIVVFIRRTR